MKTSPSISIILPTHNRADLLCKSLASLTRQTVQSDEFEVIVIDDGSTDDTKNVCNEMAGTLCLRYQYIHKSGISSAKNMGIFLARASIILFFDDDDIADPNLLAEHLRVHEANPEPQIAVLGYTDWDPSLVVTPLMEYVTDIGQMLFAYQNIKHGEILGFEYFWGGRSSCKKTFLTTHGVFNQSYTGAMEDIELAFRLSRFGLTVVYTRKAVSHMIRPVTFDGFYQRCKRQGMMLAAFRDLHPDPVVIKYCRLADAESEYWELRPHLVDMFARIREIEALLEQPRRAEDEAALLNELRRLYGLAFRAATIGGALWTQSAEAAP